MACNRLAPPPPAPSPSLFVLLDGLPFLAGAGLDFIALALDFGLGDAFFAFLAEGLGDLDCGVLTMTLQATSRTQSECYPATPTLESAMLHGR